MCLSYLSTPTAIWINRKLPTASSSMFNASTTVVLFETYNMPSMASSDALTVSRQPFPLQVAVVSTTNTTAASSGTSTVGTKSILASRSGAIAGIAIGVAIAIVGCIICFLVFMRRRNPRLKTQQINDASKISRAELPDARNSMTELETQSTPLELDGHAVRPELA
jgi:hypothetical protein